MEELETRRAGVLGKPCWAEGRLDSVCVLWQQGHCPSFNKLENNTDVIEVICFCVVQELESGQF